MVSAYWVHHTKILAKSFLFSHPSFFFFSLAQLTNFPLSSNHLYLLFLPCHFQVSHCLGFCSLSITPSSSSPPSLCLSFSYPFIKSLSGPITYLILTSFSPFTPCQFTAHSVSVSPHLPQSPQLSRLSPSIYLLTLVASLQLIFIPVLLLNAAFFLSLMLRFSICSGLQIPSILWAAFVGWFYYMSPNCWIIQ